MSGKSKDSTTTNTTEPYSGQKPYLDTLFQQSGQFLDAGVSDLSGATNAAQDAVNAYRSTLPQVGNIAQGAANQQQFLSGDVLNPGANPALQQYIDLANQTTTRNFNQNVLPRLSGEEVAVGGVGGSRGEIAKGLAVQGLNQQIGQQTAAITSQAYGQGLNAYTKGLALAPQTAGLQGAEGQAQQQISSLIAGIETLPQQQQLELLQSYQNLIGGAQFGGTTTSTGPGTKTGGAVGALGGAATGIALGTGGYLVPALGALAGYLG